MFTGRAFLATERYPGEPGEYWGEGVHCPPPLRTQPAHGEPYQGYLFYSGLDFLLKNHFLKKFVYPNC